MTGEGEGSRRIGAAGQSGGAESRRRPGACPVCGAKLRNPPRFRRRSPAFFASTHGGPPCSAAFVPAAPREVEKLRVFRLRPPVFSSFARAFFVRRPGHPAPRGEVRRPSRARIAHPSATFRFSLHHFTHPAQHADYLPIVGEDFAFPPSPRSSLPHGGRRRGQQVQRARSEIGQFLLMHR